MQCTEAKAYLYEYLTNRLDDAARKEVDVHVQTCPVCKKELQELEVDVKLLDRAKPPELSADFKDKVLAGIERSKVIPLRSRRYYRYVLQGSIAAAVVLAVAITFIIKTSSERQQSVVRSGGKEAVMTEACRKAAELYNRATMTQEPKASEQLFTDALACDCQDNSIRAKIYNNLADSYERQDMLDKALEGYKKAIELDPQLIVAHISLGDIYSKKSMYKEAASHYEKALALMKSAQGAGQLVRQEIERLERKLQDLNTRTQP